MIYEIEVSEQADSDLRGIFEYIAFELQSPENASGQLDRLEEQILSMSFSFMLGSLSEWNGQHTMPWRSGSMPYISPTCRTVMADLIF